MKNALSSLVLGLSISLGLVTTSIILYKAIDNFRSYDRKVTVKGLAEQEVDADLALWQVEIKNSNDHLEELYNKNEKDKETIKHFFKKFGITEDEFSIKYVSVTDMHMRENNDSKSPLRYLSRLKFEVHTKNAQNVIKCFQSLDELVKSDIIIEGSSNPEFHYTKLVELRPKLLEEATRSARSLAEQFARDSGNKIGTMANANQGVFRIFSRDGSNASDSDYMEIYSFHKIVRVVSTITYYLK